MAVRLILDVMSNFCVILPLVMSNSAWPLNDELSASETEFSLNDEVLASDQFKLSMNLDSSPEPDFFFDNVKNSDLISNDGNNVGGSFDFADCSSSELFPTVDKLRIRRRDGSEECKNPTSTPSASGFSLWGPDIDPWDILQDRVEQDSMRHRDCVVLTSGLLPFGLCHSGVGAVPSKQEVKIGGVSLRAFDLQHCSPSMFQPKLILL